MASLTLGFKRYCHAASVSTLRQCPRTPIEQGQDAFPLGPADQRILDPALEHFRILKPPILSSGRRDARPPRQARTPAATWEAGLTTIYFPDPPENHRRPGDYRGFSRENLRLAEAGFRLRNGISGALGGVLSQGELAKQRDLNI